MNQRLLILILCAFSLSFSVPKDLNADSSPPYINYDRGFVRDPYAPPIGEKNTFKNVQEAIKKIVSADSYEGEATGIEHSISSFYSAYEYLHTHANASQLIELLDNNNPVTRCYSVMALAGKLSNKQYFELGGKLIKDHESYGTLHYDMGGESTVSECMLEAWYPELDQNSKTKFAEYLLSERTDSDATKRMLVFWELDDQLYSKVRKLYEEGDELAIIGVAGFNKDSDLPVLLKSLNSDGFIPYKIISRFPHQSFLPFLENTLQVEIQKIAYLSNVQFIYEALLEYPPDVVFEILEPYLSGKNGEIKDIGDHGYMLSDLMKNKGRGKHIDLKLELFRNWKGITPTGLEELVEFSPKRTADVAVEILSAKPKPKERVSYDLEVVYIFSELLALVEEYRPDALDQALIMAASRSDINTFPLVGSLLERIKPEGSIEVLLYLAREVRQASYLARVIETIENIDPTMINVSTLNENQSLSTQWEHWEGENCNNMIDYHVKTDALNKRLKQQCQN